MCPGQIKYLVAIKELTDIDEYVKCVNCGNETPIDISKAIDTEGEVFKCVHCGFIFRYTLK